MFYKENKNMYTNIYAIPTYVLSAFEDDFFYESKFIPNENVNKNTPIPSISNFLISISLN